MENKEKVLSIFSTWVGSTVVETDSISNMIYCGWIDDIDFACIVGEIEQLVGINIPSDLDPKIKSSVDMNAALEIMGVK